MFNSVTAERLRSLPPVDGVDSQRVPQILSQVYAHIVGLKTKYEAGVLNFEDREMDEDYQLLNNLAFTLELYLESGRFDKEQDAIAFVAAMSHKLMSKLRETKKEPLTLETVPSDLVSVLMFVIGGYVADAEELSYEIKRRDDERESCWRVKQDICLLVRGKLHDLTRSRKATLDKAILEGYAEDLLWNHLSDGIRSLAVNIVEGSNNDYTSFFKKVEDLSSFWEKDADNRYDFPGVSRLARLLLMASKILENQSVLKRIDSHVSTPGQHELIQRIAIKRPYLWRNHIDAIERGFLREGMNSVVTFPTGAGKSTLVDLKIVQHVATGGKVVYIVPTHALEYQVKNNMSKLLNSEKYKYLSFGKEFTTQEEDDLPVMVMTPERCSTLLALNPKVFEDVTLVMMDEFHIIGEDGHRSLGAMYSLVSLLAIVPNADFVLVSAMVENGKEIADWIADTTKRECLDLSMAWKPTSQLQGCIVYPMKEMDELQSLAKKEKNTRKWKQPSNSLRKELVAIPYCLFSLCNTWESDKFSDYYLTPILDHQVQLGVNKTWNLIGNRNQVAKELAKKFASIRMKTIVFVENPSQANSLVKRIDEETGKTPLPDKLRKRRESIITEFGDDNCTYLKENMGALPHHAQLLNEEKLAMESLFKGESDILVATPTLAQGVNLPVDIVLIAGEDRYDSEKDGRDQKDAHEILNAAGRAGRAGFRSQGAAILISNKIIGIEANTLTEPWFDLKNNIFSKGDHCLTIVDPIGKLVEETNEGAEMSQEQRLVLMKLNLLGENEKEVIDKSFYAYQMRCKNQNVTDFEDRLIQLSEQFAGNDDSPLMELSLKTGISLQLLNSFYQWLDTIVVEMDYSVIRILKLYCRWLYHNPKCLHELLSFEGTLELLIKSFRDTYELDDRLIYELYKVLMMYVKGRTLKEISNLLSEKPSDHYITATRKFVLKVIPELSFAFSVLAMVHIQFLKDHDVEIIEIPNSIRNFATYLKEGVLSEEMLLFKTERRLMRVEAHKMFNER